MPPTLVDSNVILDIVTQDDEWLDWSADALERSAGTGRLVINPVIYAEVSIGFSTIEELEDAVPSAPDGRPRESAIAPTLPTASSSRQASLASMSVGQQRCGLVTRRLDRRTSVVQNVVHGEG